MSKPELEELIAQLDSDEPKLRADAALLLGEIGDPRAVQPLVVKLRELQGDAERAKAEEPWLDRHARWACVRALRSIGDHAALPVFVEVLGSDGEDDSLIRADAASALGEMRASGAIPILLNRLANDPSALVRRSVARTLGELEHEELAPQLLQALMNDEDEIVRAAAGESLARLT